MLRKALNKKKKGFTLIELIIVIAIIAILAAVALPKFMEVREKGNIKADISTAKNIQTIVATLVSDNKIATNNLFDLTSNTDTTVAAILGSLQDKPVLKATTGGKDKHILVDIDNLGNIKVYFDAASATTAANLIYPSGAGVYENK